jgi:ribonuclease J
MLRRNEPGLVFLPLGGVGEIGMNCALYGFGTESDRRWIMVDCGITFGDVKSTPGVDLVYPDISFIEEEREDLVAILLTHAHEDHYGAIADLWPRLRAPVYATPFTAGLLEAKQQENQRREKVPVTVIEQGTTLSLDPFEVEYVAVSHSIPEPNALRITTPLGTVVHSGDWKIDPTPGLGVPMNEARFREIGTAGVRALVCDSTNAIRAGRSPSEADVAKSLADIVREAPNRVAVTTFSSNVARLKAVLEAAAAAERHVVVMGRAIKRVLEVARELGYLEGLPAPLEEDDYGYLPRDKVVLLLTGSQGEERAALSRIASDDHPRVALSPGDLVIFSSRTIPGNEKAVNAVLNGLAKQRVDILTSDQALVHVSGHPRRDELGELYDWLKPELVVPVHGEPLHLFEHAEFAEDRGIREVVLAANGDVVQLAPGPGKIVDDLDVDVELLDGKLLLPPADSGVDDRRRLAFAGCVVGFVMLDERFELADDPDVVTFGIPGRDGRGDDLAGRLVETLADAVESIPRPRRRDRDMVAMAGRRALRSYLSQNWGKKPLCKVRVALV